jgi:MraZ protein
LIFRGTFEHALDAKHRLTVPSKYRATFADGIVVANSLQTNPSAPRSIGLWRPDDFDAYSQGALAGLSPFSDDARAMKHFFFSGSDESELDAAFRVMVKPMQMEWGGLDKEVVIVGAGDCLEVFDRAAYAGYNQDIQNRLPDIAKSLAHTS